MKSWLLLPLRALRGVGRIPPSDLAILSEAGLFLALARVAVAVVPFRLLVRRFGRPIEPAHGPDFVPVRIPVSRVRWAVLAVAARVPLSSPCLPQAMAAKGRQSKGSKKERRCRIVQALGLQRCSARGAGPS